MARLERRDGNAHKSALLPSDVDQPTQRAQGRNLEQEGLSLKSVFVPLHMEMFLLCLKIPFQHHIIIRPQQFNHPFSQ